MKNLLLLTTTLLFSIAHGQGDSLKINKLYDDISGSTNYIPSKKINISDPFGDKKITLTGHLIKEYGKITVDALICETNGFGCLDKPYIQMLFTDSTRLVLTYPELNCKGFAIFLLEQAQSNILSSKKISKLRLVNNGESVTGSVEKQNYFVKLYQLADNYVTGDPIIERPVEKKEILTVVDQMPEYIGGSLEMTKYIQNSLKNFKMSKDVGLSGKCFAKFVVDSDGSIKDVSILKGVPGCPECDKEALRIILSMPRWKPAKQNGQNVAAFYNLPINFQLK